MSAFKSISLHFAHGKIAKLINETRRVCKPANLHSAGSILLLIDGRNPAHAQQAKAWAAEQAGKEVHIFSLQDSGVSGQYSYLLKETNWADLPKPEVVQRCTELPAELCILFNPLDVPSLHFLAMAHPAGMKVTTVSQFPSHADFVYDNKEKDLAAFLAELAHFMENILV